MNNIEEKQRCKYELIVEEFFGYKMTEEDKKFTIDDFQLTNLVCFAHQKLSELIEDKQEQKVYYEWVKVEKDEGNLPEYGHISPVKYLNGKLRVIDAKYIGLHNYSPLWESNDDSYPFQIRPNEWLKQVTIPKQIEGKEAIEFDLKDYVSIDEYENAVNKIGQLQEQLEDAEKEIRELNREIYNR